LGGVYSIWRRTQRRREEEEAGAKKRKKIYEPGDVSQVLCSLSLSRLFLGRWLAGKRKKKGAAGPGGYPAKKKGGRGRELDFSYRAARHFSCYKSLG
jgi:hypothetical protein